MAVFRIERTKDYTVMSNHHLRNHEPVSYTHLQDNPALALAHLI